MLFFILGVELTDNDTTRIIPITKDLFSPDIHVMNQKIIRYLFPDAAPGFIKTLVESNSLSNIKLYPLLYTPETASIPTPINVAAEFALFTKMATGKSQLTTDRTIDLIASEIKDIIDIGFKQVIRGHKTLATNVKSRSINIENKQSEEVLVFHVEFATLVNKKFIVKIFKAIDEVDTVSDIFTKSIAYFQSSKLPDTKLSYELEIGFLNSGTKDFSEICEFLPNEYLVDNVFNRQVMRAMQYRPEVVLGNVVKYGAEKVGPSIERKNLAALKQIKFIGE